MSQTESQGASIVAKGRIVYISGGDIFKGAKKLDEKTRQPVLSATGEPVIEYSFGLAVPKAEIGPVWNVIQQQALQIYPDGRFPPDFAWKFKDGDGVDHNGRPFSERAGYAGCIVLNLSSRIPPKFFKWENGQHVMISSGIKCGDYVEVNINALAHPPKNRGKAGMYLNPGAVRFWAYGEEIVNAPSGDNFFGTAAPVAPPPGGSLMPPTPSATMPGAAAPAPHYGVVPGPLQPQAAPAPAPAPWGNAPVPAAAPTSPQYGQPMPTMPQNTAPSMGFPGGPAPMPGNGGTPQMHGLPQPSMPQGSPGGMPTPQGFPWGQPR